MSLRRYLPIPSDRMGIIWSLLSIKGAMVLEYGPSGTTHFSMGTFQDFGIDQENQLFSTHMSEDDVIMGDVSRLEKSIVEIDAHYEPKAIFIVASSVSSVVGTDLKAVCNYMQEEVKAKLYALENGGFRGDFAIGIRDVYSMLAKEAVKPSEGKVQEKTFNILGASSESYRMESDIWQLQYMMERAFGYQMLASLTTWGSLETIPQAGEACLNLVLRNEALPAAKHLEKKQGTPYLYRTPYGYNGSIEWLKEVGDIIGEEPDKGYLAEILKNSREVAQMKVFRRMMLKKDSPKALVAGSYDAVCGLSKALEEIGIDDIVKISTHSLKLLEDPGDVVHYEKEKDMLEVLKGTEKALVFADDVSLKMCGDDCTKVLFSSPWVFHPQIAKHLPFMGERGMDYILEQAQAYFRKLN